MAKAKKASEGLTVKKAQKLAAGDTVTVGGKTYIPTAPTTTSIAPLYSESADLVSLGKGSNLTPAFTTSPSYVTSVVGGVPTVSSVSQQLKAAAAGEGATPITLTDQTTIGPNTITSPPSVVTPGTTTTPTIPGIPAGYTGQVPAGYSLVWKPSNIVYPPDVKGNPELEKLYREQKGLTEGKFVFEKSETSVKETVQNTTPEGDRWAQDIQSGKVNLASTSGAPVFGKTTKTNTGGYVPSIGSTLGTPATTAGTTNGLTADELAARQASKTLYPNGITTPTGGGTVPLNYKGEPVYGHYSPAQIAASFPNAKAGETGYLYTSGPMAGSYAGFYMNNGAWVPIDLKKAKEQLQGDYTSTSGGKGGGGSSGTTTGTTTSIGETTSYDVAGAPTWWSGIAIKNPDTNQQYANELNAAIPFMSPEDQQAASEYLANNFDEFAVYKNVVYATPPSTVTTALRDQYTSKDRANRYLDTLEKMRGALGLTEAEMGTGYAYLKTVGNILSQFGGGAVGTGNMQSRQQYQQQLTALNPVLNQLQNSTALSPYYSVASYLATPTFSAGPLVEITKNSDGTYSFGAANNQLWG